MPGVLPMEICHIYHAIMSLTMHLVPLIRNTQRRNYRDCRAGDSQQSALRPRCTPIPSIFHPAPRRRSVSILEKLLYFSLSKVEKKGKKKGCLKKIITARAVDIILKIHGYFSRRDGFSKISKTR